MVEAPRVVQSNLTQLASSLQGFDGNLASWVQERQAQQIEQDHIRGNAAFYQNNQQGFADAVSSGAIPAQASPAFVAGYKKAQGSLAGFDLQSRFASAYDQWDGKGSEDPQAFTKFAQDFFTNNMGNTQDPAILRGLMPHVQEAMTQGLAQWVQDRHKTLYEGSIIAHNAVAAQTIDQATSAGLASGSGTDYPALFSSILDQRQQAITSGVNPVDFDKQLVQTIKTEAITKQDPGLLKFFDQQVPGQDYTFGNTPHGGVEVMEATRRLDIVGRRMMAEQAQLQVRQDKAAKNAVTAAAIDMLSQNPGAPLPETILQAGSKYDPEFRLHMIDAQKKLVANDVPSDPQGLLQLHSDIINGGGIDALNAALVPGGAIHNKTDLDNAYSLVKSVAEGGDPTQKVLTARSSVSTLEAIKARAMSNTDMDQKLAGIGGISDQGLAAQYDFKQMLLQWSVANPTASPEDREAYIAKAGALVLKSLGGGDVGVSATYSRPAGSQATLGDNPFPHGGEQAATPATTPTTASPAAAPAASPTAPTPGAAPAASPTTPAAPAYNPADAATRRQWFTQNLRPDQQAIVQQDATAKGLTLDKRIWDLQQGQQVGTPGKRSDAGGIPGVVGTAQAGEMPQGAPVATTGATQPTPVAPAMPAQHFDLAVGDSIAVQQVRHGVPGLEGHMGAPSQPVGTTAVVGDSPQAVLQRITGLAQANPDQFTGKNVFLSTGASNNPSQVGMVGQQVDALKAAGAANVAIPGVGPGVANQQGVNQQLQQIAQAHGATYVDSQVKFGADGVHPVEVDNLRNQALMAINKGNASPQVQTTLANTPSALDDIVSSHAQQMALSNIQSAIARAHGLTSYTPGVPFAMAALKDDPKAAALLDFIAGGVPGNPGGEAGGNYNAVIGNEKSTQDLSQMSLAEVFQLQHQLLARGEPSSAVGRYQFVGNTLHGLVQSAGLPLSTKFTPELQDQLAVQLLKGRGYDAWKAGQLSDQQFAHNLSMEWASLPDPNAGGKSHYDGVGPNHAGTTLSRTFAALRNAFTQ